MQSTLLLLIGFQLVNPEKHSLQYLYTATTGLPNFPQFVSVGIVDGQLFTYYDSNIRRQTHRQDWIAKSEGEEYWRVETQISIGTEQKFMNNINIAKDRFNQTGGVHTFQQMYGCEWDDETGVTKGFLQDGYDGDDFVHLDLKELRWISPVQEGFCSVQKWNNDKSLLEHDKEYFNTVCIEWLKKYLQYGKSSLKKTVSPQVSLQQKSSSSPVTCHATGFYPKAVKISWQRNGQDHDEDVDLGELLPNADGTFQRSSTIRVTSDERKKNQYSCVVEHQGKTIREIVKDDSLPIGIIVGAAVGALLLLVIIGVIVFKVLQKKKETDFKPVNASDDGSNNS